MRCPNCYNEIPDGSKFCQACGAPVSVPAAQPVVMEPTNIPVAQPAPDQAYQQAPQNPTSEYHEWAPTPAREESVDKKAVGSLVCGIVGFFIFGMVLGIIAIVLGSGVRKTAPEGSTSRTMATIGFVLGIIDLAGWLLVLVCCGGLAGIGASMY